jgi:hypothetical protein
MKASNKDKTLRTRPVPSEIAELLSIANNLPQELGADHKRVVNPHEYEIDSETVGFYLSRLLARMPNDLKAFVTQKLDFKVEKTGEVSLTNLDEGWQKSAGPNLLQYAYEVARPLWGAGEVESMRQRYLFLFAVRDILRCLASPSMPTKVEPKDKPLVMTHTRGWLRATQQSFLNPALRIYSRVEGLRSQLYISNQTTSEGTHKLAVYHPLLLQVLESVEAERIRACPVCGRLFWAGRLDQSACPRHGNVLRARRSREKRRKQEREEGRAEPEPKGREKLTIKKGRKAAGRVNKRKTIKRRKGR